MFRYDIIISLCPSPPVSDIPGMRRRRGSGPEPAGPGRLPGLSVLLLQERRRRLQKVRGLLRHLGRRGDGPRPLVSLRIPESQSGFFLLNPAPIFEINHPVCVFWKVSLK